MEFRRVRALRGPNIWANFPVLEAIVDLGTYKDCCSDEMPGFNDRIKNWLPSLIEHRCSVGTRGGFFERLRRGTYLAHILEHVTLELQALAGTEVGYGRARETEEEGVYRVVIEYQNEELARTCLDVGRLLCLATVHDTPFDLVGQLASLRELARRVCPSPAVQALLQAATTRNIPIFSLDHSLYQLGHGVRQRRLLGAQTDRTSALAESLSRDHELVRQIWQGCGIPYPQGRLVTDAADALAAADELGYPVRLQPRYVSGVRPWQLLQTPEALQSAYEELAREFTSIYVEHLPAGNLWRFLVVGERVVAAISADGRAVNISEEIHPPQIHPHVALRLAEAAQTIGLDVCGVDVVATTLSAPLESSGGCVLGLKANPDLEPFLDGHDGKTSAVSEAIIGYLFPGNETGRIPIVAVTGVNGKTTTVRLIAHILAESGLCVGMTCTEGIYVGKDRTESGDCSGPLSARCILQNPDAEAAVLETARGGILRAGLGFDHCNVAVVTNIASGDHLGISGIETVEDLARVKRTIVEVVAKDGAAVLKADDPLVANMANHCPGKVIFFAKNGLDPTIQAHRKAAGKVVFVRQDWIILAQGSVETPLQSLLQVPFTHEGRITFQVDNALAAAAAAWNLGIPLDTIRQGLRSFPTDLTGAPARFNIIKSDGRTFILDYGHNSSSLACVIQALDNFHHNRRICVYGAAGDRRDHDISFQGELLGHSFDQVILFEDPSCMRGRKPGETFALFRQGLAQGQRVKEIQDIPGAVKAAEYAVKNAHPGDLVLIQVEMVDETIQLVQQLVKNLEPRPNPIPERLESPAQMNVGAIR